MNPLTIADSILVGCNIYYITPTFRYSCLLGGKTGGAFEIVRASLTTPAMIEESTMHVSSKTN